MSREETQHPDTTVPQTGYTPLDSRPTVYSETVVEDRKPEQIRADNHFQAVMTAEPEHRADPRIRELEAKLRNQTEAKEFLALETNDERELYTLKRRKREDEQAEDIAADERAWVEAATPQLSRLAELKSTMLEVGGFRASHIATVEKCEKQYSTLGACQKTAGKMLEAIESQYEQKLAEDELALNSQIMGMQNKIALLQAKKRTAVEPTPEIFSEEDRLFRAAQAEWQAAEKAGNKDEYRRLRSVYFAERFKRGNV